MTDREGDRNERGGVSDAPQSLGALALGLHANRRGRNTPAPV